MPRVLTPILLVVLFQSHGFAQYNDRLTDGRYSDTLGWAEDLIAGRVDQLDVSEDLVFYYVISGCSKVPKTVATAMQKP